MKSKETALNSHNLSSQMVLESLQKINRRSVEGYLTALENNQKIRIIDLKHQENGGLVCIIHHPEFIGIYIVLSQNPKDELSFQKIMAIIVELIQQHPRKEVRLILPAENQQLIKRFQSQGFRKDYAGYEFCLKTSEFNLDSSQLKEPLVLQTYSESLTDQYIELLDMAFNPLQLKSHSRINRFKKSREATRQQMLEAARNDHFVSFWRKEMLAGLFYARESVLDIICVHPDLQNQGIGTFILKNCIKNMAKKAVETIYLYVIQENKKAIRFYLKNGFIINSTFCEISCLPQPDIS